MHVIATAGHVDHGKSTLVRALTGMEPDRWAEERRRGMTIDLGFAWTALPSGAEIAFVDVPGHQRFVPTMLAGVGPVPAVLFVVAADEMWARQSDEHLAALTALRVRHGVLAVTRSDLADPARATAEAVRRIRSSPLGDIEAVPVSGVTGVGLKQLRAALDRMVAEIPAPRANKRVRLWVDRAFTIRGSGTVVTGTLASGTIHRGDELQVAPRGHPVRVRAVQTLMRPVEQESAVARVAVNLRGMDVSEVHRGDAVVSIGGWRNTCCADVRIDALDVATRLPRELVLHIGSAAVSVAVRRLGADTARLTLAAALPLQPGDRGLLRNPGEKHIVSGVVFLDVAPEPLLRRGAAAARALSLTDMTGSIEPADEVRRRGAVQRGEFAKWGVVLHPAAVPAGAIAVGDWLVSAARWAQWVDQLTAAVDDHALHHPLRGGMSEEAARHAVGILDAQLFRAVVAGSPTLESQAGVVRRVGVMPSFTPSARAAMDEVRSRLRHQPYDAPRGTDLDRLGLTEPVLTAAARHGLLLALGSGIYLLPDVEAMALPLLGALPQPFSLAEARDALGARRRIVVALLEHLDARGLTRRAGAAGRIVVT